MIDDRGDRIGNRKMESVSYLCPKPPLILVFYFPYAHANGPHIILNRIQPSPFGNIISIVRRSRIANREFNFKVKTYRTRIIVYLKRH
jgi:hypothetical protein